MKKDFITFVKRHSFLVGLCSTVVVIFTSFVLSLQLSLYGDDWLRLHILRYMFDTGQGMSYFSLWSYLGPYNAQYPLLFLVRLFWGYNPVGYFLTSLIFRIVGSVSFYFPLKKLTKSSFFSWVGALLIGTTPVGIQVTDWVFYMNTYLALIPLAWTLYLGIDLHQKITLKKVVLLFLSSALFIFLIPVRSYAFFLTFLVFSIGEIIFQKRRRLPIFQTIGLICIYSIAKLSGDLGPTTDVFSSIQTGIKSSILLLHAHSYLFILVPLINIGKIIFPDMFFEKLQLISVRMFQPQVISFLLLFVLLGIVYYFWKAKSKKIFLLWAILNSIILTIVQIIFVAASPADQLYACIGYWFVVNMLWYGFSIQKKIYTVLILFSIFLFSLPYYLLPWSFSPAIAFTSDHRYLYFPALGMLLALTVALWLLYQNKTYRKIIVSFIILVVVINIVSDLIYFKGQLRFRSETRQEKIFSSLHHVVPSLSKNHPSMFYITDTTGIKTDVYSFGFPFAAGLYYGITDESNLPFIILNLDQLHSAVTDGKALKLYTQKITKANPNDIYYLKLLPNDTFVLNKNEALQQLREYGK